MSELLSERLAQLRPQYFEMCSLWGTLEEVCDHLALYTTSGFVNCRHFAPLPVSWARTVPCFVIFHHYAPLPVAVGGALIGSFFPQKKIVSPFRTLWWI